MTSKQNPSHSHTIEVTGIGHVFTQPLLATVIMGVSTTASTASQAVKSNSQAMTQVMAAIQPLRPQYSRGQRTEQRLTGFEVTLLTQVITMTNQVSALLDNAVAAGANQINSISFTFPREKRHELEIEARRTAVADAQAKAQTIASSLGVNIIGVANAIEVGAPSPIVRTRALSTQPPISPPSEAAVAHAYELTDEHPNIRYPSKSPDTGSGSPTFGVSLEN
jgi:uncharacterized protein YggE